MTLLLIAALGAVFLVGFSEAISIAVVLVGVYLVLNVVVIGTALEHVLANPDLVTDRTGITPPPCGPRRLTVAG